MVVQRSYTAGANSAPLKWLLNGPAVAVFATDATANRALAGAQPFILARSGAADVPASWNAQQVRSFTSYAHIKHAFEKGSIDPDVRAIMYDNEGWSFTPSAEQHDPANFVKLAAQLVHEHHLLFIATPAVDLTRVLAPGPEKRYEAYLRLNLAADSARYADVYNIQAQGSIRNLEQYSSFVRSAAEQARAANPNVTILAGISTNPSGQHVTADDIIHAIDATRQYVAGYWFNVPKPSEYCPKCNDFRPDIAVEVLKHYSPGP
jgi:hypothetical protein